MVKPASDDASGFFVEVGAQPLWVNVTGDGPAVVLLQDADCPFVRWDRGFVDRLTNAGYRVVRLDHRGSGRSTRVDDEPNTPVSLDDLAADVAALLDHLGVASAHLVGHGMGAMIAQLVAMDFADRVSSLTLIGSSPSPGEPDLPPPDEDFVEAMVQRLLANPPTTINEAAVWLADREALLAGTAYPFERHLAIERAKVELACGRNPASSHGEAIHEAPSRSNRLSEIVAPAMVVHGTVDPVYPLEHGRALALGISGAVMIEVEGLGHETPAGFLAEFAPTLLAHLDATEALL